MEKKKREMKTSPKAKVHARDFHFASGDAIEHMSGLGYSCTNKGGTIKQRWLSSVTRFELTLHMYLDPMTW
jgi:hypothetical protein